MEFLELQGNSGERNSGDSILNSRLRETRGVAKATFVAGAG
jgi:hypothetical protein